MKKLLSLLMIAILTVNASSQFVSASSAYVKEELPKVAVESGQEDKVISTNAKVSFAGYEYYGIYTINGDYYIPLELIAKAGYISSGNWSTTRDYQYLYLWEGDEEYVLSKNAHAKEWCYYGINYRIGTSVTKSTNKSIVQYSRESTQGVVVGIAEKSNIAVRLNNSSDWFDNVYTIDGDFPMVSFIEVQQKFFDISMGITKSDYMEKYIKENCVRFDSGTNTFYLGEGVTSQEVEYEQDLVGYYIDTIIEDSMTDREKVTAIHNFIINHLDYDMTRYYLDTYGLFIGNDPTNGKLTEYIIRYEELYKQAAVDGFTSTNNLTLSTRIGICETYSRLFQEFCDRVAIPNVYVAGYAPNGGGHAWNKVYLEGQWYYVDCTLDDPVGGGYERDKYLLKDADFMKKEGYRILSIDNNDVEVNMW